VRTPEQTPKLLPCPFCGTEPRERRRMDESLYSHATVEYLQVVCDGCNCESVASERHDEVIAAWNQRSARSAEPVKPVGEVKIMPRGGNAGIACFVDWGLDGIPPAGTKLYSEPPRAALPEAKQPAFPRRFLKAINAAHVLASPPTLRFHPFPEVQPPAKYPLLLITSSKVFRLGDLYGGKQWRIDGDPGWNGKEYEYALKSLNDVIFWAELPDAVALANAMLASPPPLASLPGEGGEAEPLDVLSLLQRARLHTNTVSVQHERGPFAVFRSELDAAIAALGGNL
jgi:Lar family restriction alleviation protein